MKNKTDSTRPIKTRPFFRRVISLAMVILLVLSSITVSYVAASVVMTITKSVDKTNPYVGEPFIYTIRYANPSTTEPAENVVLEDILPSNIRYVSHIPSSDVQSVTVTNNGTNDVVRFIFKPSLDAGATGFVKIEARFPPGITPATIGGLPNVAINTATIDPSNGDLITSNPVTVTPRLNAAADWSVAKTRIIPATVLPAVGTNVTYQVTVNSNSVIGGLNLKNVVLADTIPVGSTFVSASGGGTYDAGTGKITWNIASLPVGTSQSFTVVINYPTPTFTLASTVTNSVLGTATQFDDTPAPNKTASVTHGFAVPTYAVGSFSKGNRQPNDRYSVGQTARFYLTNISNTGNMPIDKFEIVDNVPAEIKLTQISTGSYSSASSVQIQYRTNLNTNLRNWTGSPFAAPPNTTLNVSALGLGGSEYVTQVKWTITAASGQIMPGFSNTAALNFNGIASAPLVGNSITNTGTLQAFNGATPFVTLNASSTIYVIDQYPWLVPIKTVPSGQTRFNYNDTVTFNLRIQNHEFATGNYVNPIAVDTIPPEYENITYLGWNAGNSGISTAPVVTTTGTKVIGGKTYTLLKANFTGTLLPGQYVNVQYSAKIKNMTQTGLLTNSLYISTLDNNTIYENDAGELITDTNDLDGDSSTTDRFVKSDATIFVNFQGALSSRKWIKGAEDSDYIYERYPTSTFTYPGGYVNYRLVVKNTGSNGPITNVVLIDKLPTIGDTGAVDPSGRGTQWTPYLVNAITGANGTPLPANVTVYYSTVVNPTCAELNNPAGNINNPADLWSTTPPLDITTVKSIKIDFDGIIMNTNDEVVLEWPMRAPVGAPLNQLAWNSFGYAATYPDLSSDGTTLIQSPFLPSEPIKVGFKILEPPPFSAGNFVWEDLDKDGIQETGEPGINNVLVNLYSKSGSSYTLYDYTRTGFDQNGNPGYYTFPNIPAGTYRVEFVYPKTYTDTNGYTSTYSPSPYLTGADRAVDSNGNPATITNYTDLSIVKNSILTPDFTISTADDMSIDLGLYRLCSIGDRVWYDFNADGLQTGENGLAGVTVTLQDSTGAQARYGNGTLVPAQTTTATGAYLFTNLEPGIYKVNYTIPSDYKLSPSNAGANDAIDSDAIKDVGATGTTANYTLLSGTQNLTVDAGMYLGHIGNLIFEDVNTDGIYNSGDLAVNGATVRLYKDGNPVAYKTTTSNASGIYSFDDLPPGTYVVEVVRPAAYQKFTLTSGTTPATDNDSDVDRTTGRTGNIVLAAGDRINTIDAGLYKFASIGNYVWNDRNANGVQDSGEPGIAGVNVKLTDNAGNPVTNGLGVVVADVSTDANGLYSFPNLDPVISKTYKVVFSNPGQNYKFSPNSGAITVTNNSDGIWANATDPTATTGTITIASGSAITYVDQGLYLGHIGNLVFEDVNVDGVYNAGDGVVNGATVNLYMNGNPAVFKTTTTNSSGIYSFDDLFPGTYVVEVVRPAAYPKFTTKSLVAADAVNDDSDTDRTTGRTGNIIITAGSRTDNVDSGLYRYATIGDRVWNDRDADGVQDAGEPNISGVTVRLTDALGNPVVNGLGVVVADTVTNASGIYSFPNLDPLVSRTYRVVFFNPGQNYALSPNNGAVTVTDNSDGVWTTLNDPSATTGIITVSSNSNLTYVDQGMYLGAIGDFVWDDYNANGRQDAGEPGINGVSVSLLDAATGLQARDVNGVLIPAVNTNSSGAYRFDDLKAGGYIVQFSMPAGWDKASPRYAAIATTATDSNADLVTYRSDTVTLTTGQRDFTIDGGFFGYARLGDFIWNDLNANGIQEAGEPGIAGATVNLLDSGGTVIGTTTTNASGAYTFGSLIPGTYAIQAVIPAGFDRATLRYQGAAATDSNLDTTTLRSENVTLISRQVNNTIDGGFYTFASIGDYVWEDVNGNGIQDAGEPGLSGVTVNLLNGAGTQIGTTTTNASGFYTFTSLVPGTYIVEVVKPAGYSVTLKTQGGNTALDSNLNIATARSDTVTLISGENNMTIDGGLYRPASIGDFIWNDTDADGIQDAGEVGAPNVTVNLLNSSGTQIATTTTNASGAYSFTNLIPATYFIEVVKPSGSVISPQYAGSDTAKDSNINIATSRSDAIALSSNENNTTIDAGLYLLASLGDYVWNDLNANGIQDAGEPAIANTTVRLLNSSGVQIATTTTNASGIYSFSNLNPGTYFVEIPLPAGFDSLTLKTAGGNTALDSNLNANFRSDAVTLVSGENNITIDGGFYKYASLGDFVWNDLNANGIQDASEPGIQGATVNLLNGSGTQVGTTTTNASGAYSFTGLVPGTYAVQVVKPVGYDNASPALQGSNTAIDSNLNSGTLTSANVTLISGQNDPTIDGGFYKFASIGDFVWDDLNIDGVQNAGELGVANVTVNLLNSGGTQIATTTTNAGGYYSFTGLVPGSYTVEVVKPASFTSFSPKNQGGNTAADSNITPATSRSDLTTLISGENNMTIDAGMYKLASLGDYVWNDKNANGIQEAGESGVPNVTVNLLNSSGTQVGTTTTDANGAYAFTGLIPGSYIVDVVKPSGYLSSPKNAGSDIAKDSNISIPTSRSDLVTLISGENNLTIDAGIYVLASLGDFIWNDLNANGIQDAGEPGIANATVRLLDSGGVQIASTLTNASGAYSFTGLTPGATYYVEAPMPAGYDVLTTKGAGGNITLDSNLNPTFRSDAVILVSGENNPTIDGGFYKYASLGDFIWNDLNANGIQDAGEPGIQGATVNLLNGSGTQVGTTTTNSSGAYSFTGLVPGTYAVQVVKPAGYDNASPALQGSNTAIDSNLNTVTLTSANVMLISGQNDPTIDGGFYKFASIGDFVWDDLNANGIQNAGEPGLNGITVRLLDSTGTTVLSTTTTNTSGFYSFTGLVPGSYIIEVVKPAAYDSFSLKNQGGDTATDSNITPATSRSDLTTLISGENNMTVDAGIYKFASLGDFVWDDKDADGIQDVGEPGVSNVTVNLLNSGGTQIATTVTNPSGAYAFTGLIPGSYIVEVVKPSGYLSSPKTTGSDITKDSNINIPTSRSDLVTLISGENNPTIDAGLYMLASLGDFVWNDLNANGIQDAGEPGIANATVRLLDSGGVQIGSTLTNASGAYSFAGLTPGSYYVEVPMPAGYDVLTAKGAGGNSALDSNLNTTFRSDAVTLVSGENNPTIDAGFYILASLSDFVWNDLNENGIQEVGEPGLENVTVTLYNELDVVIATTTTDANGIYLFSDLVPGNYYIKVTRPAGYIFTLQKIGSNIAVDSNVDETTGKSELVFLNSGDNNVTFDAGLRLARPAIDIEKHVSLDGGTTWHDADTPKGPQYDPNSGIDPRFKFIVTNTGNTKLTDIVVQDDVFGTITATPIPLMVPGEIWESSIITQDFDVDDLVKTGPVDWINNLNVSLGETTPPKNWDFRAFSDNPHDEGSWIIGTNYWTTGNWYYLGIIQPGETVQLPLSVLLDEEKTTNEYMGATFYLQPKFESIQITNEAVYDAWGMGYLPDISKWLPVSFDVGDSRWEATDNDTPPPISYFWDVVLKIWNLV